MRNTSAIMLLIMIALFGMFFVMQDAFANDPPHNGQNSMSMPIQCSTCHYDTTGPTPSWATDPTTTDNTYFNNLCRSCHNTGGSMDPRYIVKTHSSEQMASGKYPPWTVECRVCHNPHYQDQISSYPTETTNNLLSGTISSYTQVPATAPTSTIYVTATGLVANAWIDYMLVPNVAYPTKMYRILSNTANSFTVIGAINGRYALPGTTFGVRLSSMLLAQLRTPTGVTATIKFFTADSSKPNSYASSTNPANVTGICQVCHTQTQSFNSTGITGSIQEGPNHPPGVVAAGAKCTDCHIHTGGFKGECTTCHGSPPVDTATLIFKSMTGSAVTSDSPGPGAHGRHVNSLGYDCATCHYGGMLGGQNEGNYKVDIGFYFNNQNLGGTYDGKSGRSVYSYRTGTGSTTTVTATGSLQCTNLYCHSSGQGSTSQNATPTYAVPVWTTPGSGTCGTCHQTKAGHPLGPITSGSHTRHMSTAGGSGCGDCHTGAADDASSYSSPLHVNKSIDVANNYSAGGAAGNGYGTCSAAACHANVYGPATMVTPMWGTPSGCSACHTIPIAATGPNTGSHALHAISAGTACTNCHYAGTSSTTKPSIGHADGDIDVVNVGYPPNVAKHAAGSGYFSCNATVCHGSLSPVWGANTTDAQCVKCHGVTGTSPSAYAANTDLAAPGYNNVGINTARTVGTISNNVSNDPKVGAHNAHLQGLLGYKTNGIACTDCHAVTTLNSSGHMNGSTTFVWSSLATKSGALIPTYSGGQCSNVYCHGAGMKYAGDQGSDITPQWTDGAYLTSNASTMNASDCNKCHLSPATNSSYNHQNISLLPNACNACHGHDGSGLTHIDGILQATGGACDACHSYDVDANGDWGSSPKAVEGWGAHATHIRHLKTVNSVTLSAAVNTFGGPEYTKVCGICHTLDPSLHSMSSQTNVRSITFSDGSQTYQFAVSSGSPTYKGITNVPSATQPKVCYNISCHFQQSPVWEGY